MKKNKLGLVIYHRVDFDGKGSGFLARKYLEKKKYSVRLYGYNYNEPFNYSMLEGVSRVIITDIHLKEKDMIDLINREMTITLIDHHLLNEDYLSWLSDNDVEIVHNTKWAAIQLTWDYCFPDKSRPLFVDWLGDYDRWYNVDEEYWNKFILPFQMWMKAQNDTDPNNYKFWNNFFSWPFYKYSEAIKTGKQILKYDGQLKASIVKEYSFEKKFEGLNAIVCNSCIRNSRLFDSVYNPNKHDIMIVFSFSPRTNQWVHGLYSDKDSVDCSAIAKKYGGGGHKGAAGFSTDKLIFIKE